ncbi:hypothetical protein Tco_0598107 [Tanacetum coccineum]
MYHFNDFLCRSYISCAIDLEVTRPGPLFRCDPIWGCYRLVSRAKVIENQARSWSIPSEDPYEEAANVVSRAATTDIRSRYLRHYTSVTFLSLSLLRISTSEDEAPIPLLHHHPSRLHGIRPLPPKADVPEADARLEKTKNLLPLPDLGVRVGQQEDHLPGRCLPLRESSEFCTRHHDAQKGCAAVRAEIEILRRERLAYEQESMETRQALARSEAHCRTLEARVAVLETEVHRHEWQRQAADDLAVRHIMRTRHGGWSEALEHLGG